MLSFQVFDGKLPKNSPDHRKGLLLLTNWFLSNMKNLFLRNLFETLCTIIEVLYLPRVKKKLTANITTGACSV